jgi:RNA polymerase sigma-70 factor (ECF subfamily)
MPTDFADDGALIDALRAGDEAAFGWMVDLYNPLLLRTARLYVATDAQADEVVQETWLAVIKGLDRFERRSSIKTWIYRILMNIARTKGVRESRSVPFSSAPTAMVEGADATFSPDRFRPPDDPEWPGHWASFPLDWEHQPETRVLAAEALSLVGAALQELPPAQREVLTLRDVNGWSSTEVCHALGVSETNQRVLLHRGRAKVRSALESYFEGSELS